MRHIKKRYYVLGSMVLIIFLLLFFLSTVVKNYINTNSKELIGRKVELGGLSINYFRVAITASELAIYEANEKDTFAGFRELSVNFDPTRLFSNEYSFSSILLDSLHVNVIRSDEGFNFDDLIPPSDSATQEVTDTIPSKPFRFAIHNIKFNKGNFNFLDKTVNNEIDLEDISLDLPLIAWDSESSDVGIGFEFGQTGKVLLDAHVDQLKNEYTIDFQVSKLGLNTISSYVEDVIDAGGIEGFVNTKLHIVGHMVETSQIVVKGEASIDSFRIWDLDNKDVLSFKQFSVGLEKLDIGQDDYHLSHLTLNHPRITASLYKDMTNIERMLLPVMSGDSTVQENEVVDDTTTTASAALAYRIDKLTIDKGEVLFSDHTLYRPFYYDLKDIDVELRDVTNTAEQVPVTFAINMNDQGHLSGQSTINMLQPTVFSLNAKLEKLGLLSFSPYTEFHIARPITQGSFNYDLSIDMTPTHMVNNNVIVINELEIGDKTQNEPQVNVPVKLGLYLMKDPHDVIKIHMPVEGDPSDPSFSVSKIIWKAFSNLLIKAAASPFHMLGNLAGTRPEELENIPMPYAQDSLSMDQRNTLDKIANILAKKPQLNFSFRQQTDPETEKSVLAVNLAKKQMLSASMSVNNEKQIARYNERLASLPDDDPEFLDYISKVVPNSEGKSLTVACRQLIGEDELDDAFTKLLINRNEQLSYYLLQEKGVDSTSIEVSTADLRNLPEQLKSCNYKVEVSIK